MYKVVILSEMKDTGVARDYWQCRPALTFFGRLAPQNDIFLSVRRDL